VLATALRLQVVLSGALAALFFGAAPQIAALLNDPALIPLLRISAVIPFAYASYAAMIGYANGLRQFGRQAGFDIAFSFFKLSLMLVLAAMGWQALGAITGFSAASVLILLAAWAVIGRSARRQGVADVSPSDILRYEATVMGHVAFTNLLMQLDLLMLKALYVAAAASVAAGIYGAAAKLAQIPYSVLVALNFLIFPLIARSTTQSDARETAVYIRQAIRLGIALSVGPAVVLAVLSDKAIPLVFGSGYGDAAPALAILAFGYVLFSLLTLNATIINSSGKPGISLAITGVTVALQATFAWELIPRYGVVGAAIASSLAYLVGAAAAMTYLVRKYPAVVPWASIARTGAAALVVMAMSRTPLGETSVLIAAPALGVIYLASLVALREWGKSDLQAVLRQAPAAGPAAG
jgi:stage V sporulation protein B